MLETEIQMALDISNILKSGVSGKPVWKQLSNLEWAINVCGELKNRLDAEYTKLYHSEKIQINSTQPTKE